MRPGMSGPPIVLPISTPPLEYQILRQRSSSSLPRAMKHLQILLPVLCLLLEGHPVRADVQINEIVASNTRSFPDITDFEDYPDWIELGNTGATAVSLDGYFLSDDAATPLKWRVPAGASIPGNGYLMIMADGHDAAPGQTFPRGYWPWKDFQTGRYHTNFNLSATGESVVLSKVASLNTVSLVNASIPPATAAVWKYQDNGSDLGTQWMAKNFDDSAWASGPSPLGYGDSPATTVSFGASSSNKYITTYFRHSFHVAESANIQELTLRLQVDDGCIVYLNGKEVIRRNLPAGTVNSQTVADSAVGVPEESQFNTYTLPGSSLNPGTNVLAVEVHQASAGSSDLSLDLGLTGSDYGSVTAVDSVSFGTQIPDIPYGREAVAPFAWKYFAEATPGTANTAAAVNDIRVSGNPVTVSLPGGFYSSNQTVTLGSAGGTIRYTLDGSNPRSSSAMYSSAIPITATTVLRACCFEDGKVPGPVITRTFFRNETLGNVAYVSLVADPETLFGDVIGIYKNKHEPVTGGFGLNAVYKGKDAPGNVEFFASGGAPGFSVGCGIRIGGENNWVHPQKALNLAIRGKYGDDNVTANIFPDTGVPVYSGLTLRDGGDNWDKDMLRDGIFPKLAHGFLNVDTADYRPSVVFINGAYFGIHDIRQRWDETWFAQQYHIPADKIDHLLYGHVISSATTLGADKGDTVDWLDLLNFLDTADLTTAANWSYVESKIDVDSFMDFVISESYGNNTAWHHNREFWKEKSPGAKWRWFLTDMDRTLATSTLTGVMKDMLGSEEVLVRLKRNSAFMQRLAQRYAAHMASTFKPSRVKAIVTAMDVEDSALVPRHAARWAPDGTTVSRRNSNIQNIKDYADQRAANVYDELTSQLGTGNAVNFTLGVNNPSQGGVRVQGIPVEPSTFKIFPNAPFTLEAVPAPGFAFTGWTGTTGGASVSVTLTGNQSITANFASSGETVIGGTLAANTTLTRAHSPYALSSDLIVPAGISLDVEAGVAIHMPAARNLRVQGALHINGSAEQPVSITGRNGERWGGMSFENPDAPSSLAHLIVRGATKGFDPTIYYSAISGLNATLQADYIDITECDGTFYMYGGSCVVRDSRFYTPYTGDGLHVKRGRAVVQRCVFPGNNAPDTDGIDFDGVTDGVIEDCRVYRFQGSNSDGIDIGEACRNILMQGNLIYYNSDKGFSVGQGSTVTIRKNLVVGCDLGVGIKDAGSSAMVDQNTFVSCGGGVEVYEKNFGSGGGAAVVTNTIFSKSVREPAGVDSLSTLSVAYSLSDTLPLPGTGNLLADPGFVDPVVLNFQLRADSPAINAGDPAHTPDPDASAVDIGAQYVHRPSDYPYTIGETVVVNEILANSAGAGDWIELHNRTANPMDIGGWFLSDSGMDLQKYRIPKGTIIAADGYKVFYEQTNFGTGSIDTGRITPFAISDTGETVFLSSAVDDQLTDYQTKEDFGPSLAGETLGTYYKPSSDSWNFVAMATATPGAANSGPRTGPIVISEIMYHPGGNGDSEYIELLNISDAPVVLYDAAKGQAWRVSDGIEFEFPSNPPVTLAPGERLILTRNAAQFTVEYGTLVPVGTQVFQWSTGGLDNGGETLQLDRPGPLDEQAVQTWVRQDRVNYSDAPPWPGAADGHGPSLSRISENDYGNDAANWTSASASPGSITVGLRFADWASTYGVMNPADDPDHDGVSNLLEYALGTDPLHFSSDTPPVISFSAMGISISYQVNSVIPDVSYILETSSDLQTWAPVGAAPVSVTNGQQLRTHLETPPVPTRHFYRLKLELKP